MTQGFYEQLGVDPTASTREIRTAYIRLVRQLEQRRNAAVDSGGDTSLLDLAHNQAEEAWAVLSESVRRRRYDAMVAIVEPGFRADSHSLWNRVSGAVVHPALGAAAELLRVSTNLKVGALPPAPQPAVKYARRIVDMEDEATQFATSPTHVAVEDDFDATDFETAEAAPYAAAAPTHLHASSRGSASAAVSDVDVAKLVENHGYSGAFLKSIRSARGLSVQDMADKTRISNRYLEAIEADEFETLPSPTFVRGYVREMAKVLNLDENAVVTGYMRRMR